MENTAKLYIMGAAAVLVSGVKLEDWKHLYKYCGNNPRKGVIAKRIQEMKKEE